MNKALQLFTINGLEVYGLDANDCQEYAGDAHVVFAHPDKLVMEWSFQLELQDINSAINRRRQEMLYGIATQRSGAFLSILLSLWLTLCDHTSHHLLMRCPRSPYCFAKETVQRIELSSAVDTELELPDMPIYNMMRPYYQRVAPIMYRTGGAQPYSYC